MLRGVQRKLRLGLLARAAVLSLLCWNSSCSDPVLPRTLHAPQSSWLSRLGVSVLPGVFLAARWTGNSRLLQGPTLGEGSVPRGKAASLPKQLLAVPRGQTVGR